MRDSTPAISHTADATATDPPLCRSTTLGTMKMPEPMTLPMTSSVRSVVPNVRRSVDMGAGQGETESNGDA